MCPSRTRALWRSRGSQTRAGMGGRLVGNSLGLKSDGSIVAWGHGSSELPSPNEGFVAIATGGPHCLGLKSDGSIIASGSRPGYPPAPNADFVAIAAGYGHSLGIRRTSPTSIDDNPEPDPEAPVELPRAYAITAVAPNRFNPGTTVSFDLPWPCDVSVTVYDLRGRLVRTIWDGALEAGTHRAEWNGRDERGVTAPAGVYLVRWKRPLGSCGRRR